MLLHPPLDKAGSFTNDHILEWKRPERKLAISAKKKKAFYVVSVLTGSASTEVSIAPKVW